MGEDNDDILENFDPLEVSIHQATTQAKEKTKMEEEAKSSKFHKANGLGPHANVPPPPNYDMIHHIASMPHILDVGPWYVSNVSIISDVSCWYYANCYMFSPFFIAFLYIFWD